MRPSRAELFTALIETRRLWDLERAAWAEERKMLLNAALSSNKGDFLARQQATKPAKPEPLHAVPVEAREAKPRVLGF